MLKVTNIEKINFLLKFSPHSYYITDKSIDKYINSAKKI